MNQSIRVGLIDWDVHVRSGRKLLIESTPGLDLVYESSGMESDVDGVLGSLIDVLVIEQRLGGWSGIDFIQQLRLRVESAYELPRIVITSPFETEQLLLQAFEAGVNSVVSLERGLSELTQAINQSGQPGIEILDLYRLLSSLPTQRISDLALRARIDALPEEFKDAVRGLAAALHSGSEVSWEELKLVDLAKELEIRELPEIFIKLWRGGLLDGE
ncbi:MAG: hypothetical protein ACKOXT_00620 [Actinomycetota bacterium]